MKLLFAVLILLSGGTPPQQLAAPLALRCKAASPGYEIRLGSAHLNLHGFDVPELNKPGVGALVVECWIPKEKGGTAPPGDAPPKHERDLMTKPKIDHMTDSRGNAVPIEMVTMVDRLRDRLVLKAVRKFEAEEKRLAKLKADTFREIETFLHKSGKQYGEEIGGVKGNVTLTSYDGRFKLLRAVADYIVFDERLQVAKSLIDQCIHEWSEGSRPEIRALVNDAFQVDKQGNVSTTRILGLRRLDIKDAKWKRAMDAIGDSITTLGTKSYVRVLRRVGDSDEFQPIRLDIAKL